MQENGSNNGGTCMNNHFFKNKVAVVTGAGGTLCSEIAIHLASLGAKVVLVGRTVEKLEKTASQIKKSGGNYLIKSCDSLVKM